MKDFIAKIEDFVFDLLGILLPGIVFLLLFITPLFLFNHNEITDCQIGDSKILAVLKNLSVYVDSFINHQTGLVVGAGLLFSYILGHLIKVLAIIQYDFSTALFDNFVNKGATATYYFLKRKVSWILKKISGKKVTFYLWLKKVILNLWKPMLNLIDKIFTFRSPNYFSDNENLKNECIQIINEKYKTVFPEEWYSLYKLSTVIHSQEGIKSLTHMFLAKYNSYRSMAFCFFVSFFYYLIFFNKASGLISSSINQLADLILIFLVLLWITFHYKFKRYWTLCGNESLVSLYYFLKKQKYDNHGGKNPIP